MRGVFVRNGWRADADAAGALAANDEARRVFRIF